ncbi:jg25841 [Pararge aegeria aegeria]|uniref:Jg25841 protein n=1 Tax=Pararge aegeria aegeria TaxID=348720 RepID=A0A8S4QEG8_9NEOP|nr:jg25841 [Pararge aegeria aegeria]
MVALRSAAQAAGEDRPGPVEILEVTVGTTQMDVRIATDGMTQALAYAQTQDRPSGIFLHNFGKEHLTPLWGELFHVWGKLFHLDNLNKVKG